MFGNQVKAWFEINSRRIDKEAREDIKKQFKEKLGLTTKADPYTGEKDDNVFLMFCPYDSVDEDSDFGCKKDFQKCQGNINISQILREKVLKKLLGQEDFLRELSEEHNRKYGKKLSYNLFAAIQQDLDSECDNERAIDLSLDNDIVKFLFTIDSFNTILIEPYHSED